jgi:siroheme synthase-like protein
METAAKALFPIFLRLENCRALVVGGGSMAALRVRQLLETGAVVTVVAPRATPGIADLAKGGQITLLRRNFLKKDLQPGYFIVIGATDDPATQAVLAREAKRLGLLYNVVDHAEHSNFITPAVVTRGSLRIAICTQGRSPVLAGRLRRCLEQVLPQDAAGWTEALGRLREGLKSALPAQYENRKQIIDTLIDRVVHGESPY